MCTLSSPWTTLTAKLIRGNDMLQDKFEHDGSEKHDQKAMNNTDSNEDTLNVKTEGEGGNCLLSDSIPVDEAAPHGASNAHNAHDGSSVDIFLRHSDNEKGDMQPGIGSGAHQLDAGALDADALDVDALDADALDADALDADALDADTLDVDALDADTLDIPLADMASMPANEATVANKTARTVDAIPYTLLNIPSIDQHGIKAYMDVITKFSLLTRDEEYDIGLRIRMGDDRALEIMVLANLRFVVSIANRYRNTGVSFGDLVNQGNLGMIGAAKRFDPTRGVKFISYAVWWIRQSMVQFLSEQSGTVKLPVKQATLMYKINNTMESLAQKHGHEPQTLDVAELLNIPLADVENILRVSRNYLSLEAPMRGSDTKCFRDVLPCNGPKVEEILFKRVLSSTLREMLQSLSDREAYIVSMRYGLEGDNVKTLDDLAKEVGVSRERVRQIEVRSLEKLRVASDEKSLRDFL